MKNRLISLLHGYHVCNIREREKKSIARGEFCIEKYAIIEKEKKKKGDIHYHFFRSLFSFLHSCFFEISTFATVRRLIITNEHHSIPKYLHTKRVSLFNFSSHDIYIHIMFSWKITRRGFESEKLG